MESVPCAASLFLHSWIGDLYLQRRGCLGDKYFLFKSIPFQWWGEEKFPLSGKNGWTSSWSLNARHCMTYLPMWILPFIFSMSEQKFPSILKGMFATPFKACYIQHIYPQGAHSHSGWKLSLPNIQEHFSSYGNVGIDIPGWICSGCHLISPRICLWSTCTKGTFHLKFSVRTAWEDTAACSGTAF